jgi:cell division protein FtsI/penicillin-binding protein 2
VAFAESCNAVFAKLGLEVGAERLIDTAERYGFNRPPAIDRAVASTVPEAPSIDPTALALGGKSDRSALAETAIGQGDVRATPLQLAAMAQAVAAEGARVEPSLLAPAPDAKPEPVMSPSTARTLERLMVGVVESGTGENAALGAVQVAGKTGTGQLDRRTESTQLMESETDAWFTGYAPVSDPALAVAVLLQRQGAGGRNAAPIARNVLQAGIAAGD